MANPPALESASCPAPLWKSGSELRVSTATPHAEHPTHRQHPREALPLTRGSASVVRCSLKARSVASALRTFAIADTPKCSWHRHPRIHAVGAAGEPETRMPSAMRSRTACRQPRRTPARRWRLQSHQIQVRAVNAAQAAGNQTCQSCRRSRQRPLRLHDGALLLRKSVLAAQRRVRLDSDTDIAAS